VLARARGTAGRRNAHCLIIHLTFLGCQDCCPCLKCCTFACTTIKPEYVGSHSTAADKHARAIRWRRVLQASAPCSLGGLPAAFHRCRARPSKRVICPLLPVRSARALRSPVRDAVPCGIPWPRRWRGACAHAEAEPVLAHGRRGLHLE
jgi:hypothetical protein